MDTSEHRSIWRTWGDGSTMFHNELKAIIDSSQSLEEFNRSIIRLRDKWQINPNLLPTLPSTRG